MAQITLTIEEAFGLAQRIFQAAGVPEEDARLTADNLICADICGLSSHGLMRVEAYVRRIQKGLTNPVPHMRVQKTAENMFKIDADRALGQVAAMYALELCMEQTAKGGNAFAVINHMNHLGMASYYSKKAAEKGYMTFLCTNASPTMAPFGGVEPLLGTNPFCVSFEAGKYRDFTLDVATTAAARGKIRMYQQEGKQLPLGWAADAQGADTTDPGTALEGALLPMGGHKGYGLAMIVDALSGLLAGADLSCEAEGMFNATIPANTGCFMCMLDISRFLPRQEFVTREELWLDRIKGSRTKPGVSEIFVPGEIENRRTAEAKGEVTLSQKTHETLRSLLREAERQSAPAAD